jgi:hypothetical protein
MAGTQTKSNAPQVSFDVTCPECKCDVMLPLMKLTVFKSFSGNRIQIEWPSRDQNDTEFARVACPACGVVLTVHADGTSSKSSYRLFGKDASKRTSKK